MAVCSVTDCSLPYEAKGFCHRHYARWRHGTLGSKNVALRDRQRRLVEGGVLPELAYFAARIERVNGCWQWIGSTNGVGYGTATTPRVRGYVHRLVYEEAVGPIPPGMDLDHLCRNTLCCNPQHLEPVTRAENLRRSPLVGRRRQCIRDHLFTDSNTYTSPAGARQCRRCRRARGRLRRLSHATR